MTAHKHAELIKAKADNMELVVFEKDPSGWLMRISDIIHMNPSKEYFLCLPQHKEACLHWLNGGWVEWTREEENGERWFGKEKYTSIAGWNATNGWMLDDNIYRIKPRKEKRWIAVKRKDKTEVYVVTFNSLDEAIDTLNEKYWQFIEIEVEV